MDLAESLALSIKVIADWRVLLMAVLTLLVVAALRYAGSVYRSVSGPKRRAPSPAVAQAKAAKGRGAKPKAEEEEEDEGMVE